MNKRYATLSEAKAHNPELIISRSLDSWFRTYYLDRVSNLRDEYAELHIKNEDLEQLFKIEHQMKEAQEMQQRMMTQTGQQWPMPEHFIDPFEWQRIVQGLTKMSDQIKQP